jgi:deoxyadenosine/deoxycytidine kinase
MFDPSAHPRANPRSLRIGIVGPCAAGKSTLVHALFLRGYQAKHIAQEHSYVPDMWQRLTQPDLLIYLEVSFPTSLQRRSLNWTQREFDEQVRRLRHSHQHAHLVINTDLLTPAQVLEQVLDFLQQNNRQET